MKVWTPQEDKIILSAIQNRGAHNIEATLRSLSKKDTILLVIDIIKYLRKKMQKLTL